jgi:hypothetical protein
MIAAVTRVVPPVLVTATPVEAATYLRDLLDDYFAELAPDEDPPLVTVMPTDDVKRGTVLYRVIQASRTVAERYPQADLFLITEDGSTWRLPPPAI